MADFKWAQTDIYVTASNPAPGQIRPLNFGAASGTYSDGGLGVNVYIAGGTGISGSIPVQIINQVQPAGPTDVNVVSSVPVQISGVVPISGYLPVSGIIQIDIPPVTVEMGPQFVPNSLENLDYTRQKKLFDLTSDTVNYIGYALTGTSPASASWTIKRLSFDASGSLEAIEWTASGVATWNSRASEVYN